MLRLLLAVLIAIPCLAADYGKVTTHKIADGVYLFTTTPYGDAGLSGNSVAIIGEDAVLVFDTNGLPSTAQTILGEIGKLTPRPVRFVVNSHWHWDHWGGNQVYAQAFPGLEIVTHEATRDLMLNFEPKWNDASLKQGYPGYLALQEKRLANARAGNQPPDKIAEMEQLLAADRDFVTQKTSLTKTYPSLTFSETMTVHLGGRDVQVLHARAITAGDTYLYVPKEKILVTGDILVSPYPFAIGGTYPASWLAKLQELAALSPAIVVPGHGEAQTGTAFLESNITLFKTVLERVKAAKSQGQTLAQARETVSKQAPELAAMLGIHEAKTTAEFNASFLTVFVSRAWREMEAPLSDTPDPPS